MISSLCLGMIFFGKPVPTAIQVRGRLCPDHALASKYPLAYRLTHEIEIEYLGSGLFAALPE
jgi:hypothetical protein